MQSPDKNVDMMKARLLLGVVFISVTMFQSTAEELPIQLDDSSYESLFRTAHAYEQEETSGWHGYFFRSETLDAIVKFGQVELLFCDISPFKESVSEHERAHVLRNAAHFSEEVSERLFRDGRIDEGIAFLKRMLPPRTASDGMLRIGYVSDALLERKQFETAWKIADCGSLRDRAGRALDYVRKTIAKTYKEKNFMAMILERNRSPFVAGEDEVGIFRNEANKAVDYLRTLSEKTVDPQDREVVENSFIPEALAYVGRSDEAYAIVERKDAAFLPFDILQVIVKERRENGTAQEVDRWFTKVRRLYTEGKVRGGIDHPAATTFLWPCLDCGKYHDALDVIEKFAGEPRGYTGSPDGYFDYIPRLNIKTCFRYNSKELVGRLIAYHDETANDPTGFAIVRDGKRIPQNRFQFYSQIVKAQLNLGLVEKALLSLSKIVEPLEALESLVDIDVYCVENRTPDETARIENEAIAIFKNVDGVKEHEMGDYYLIDFYAKMAVRLMKDGDDVRGKQYLETAIRKSEEYSVDEEKKENRRLESSSTLASIIGTLVEADRLDVAADLADRFNERYIMPEKRLCIAEKCLDADKTGKAKQALRKAFDDYSRAKNFVPRQWIADYGRMGAIAVKLDDKEFFYEILNAGTDLAKKFNWYESDIFSSQGLADFVKGLAKYGDMDHPLFKESEKIGDGFKTPRCRAVLFNALGVSRAMLGDHVDARRLLKKGIESQKADPLKTLSAYCPAIVEAKSYAP